jgi:hypothetical protein
MRKLVVQVSASYFKQYILLNSSYYLFYRVGNTKNELRITISLIFALRKVYIVFLMFLCFNML